MFVFLLYKIYIFVSIDVWANVAILITYGSHDMRHRLTVVNRTPGIWGDTFRVHTIAEILIITPSVLIAWLDKLVS